MRLLEGQDDAELGIPSQKKDYVTLDFDGMVGLVDTTALPAQGPPKPTKAGPSQAPSKPSRRVVRAENNSQDSVSRVSNRTSQSSTNLDRSSSDTMFPSDFLRAPEKPSRPSTEKMEEFKKRNNM